MPTVKRKPRKNAARTDASIAALIREIEARYKLPRGSVSIVRPNRRRMDRDLTVGHLIDAWR